MKRLTALMFAIVFTAAAIVCGGCESDKSTASSMQNQYIDFNTDMQCIYSTTTSYVPMTKSDKGYYYVGEDGIVIYVDASTQKATPLCSKPNCTHDDPDTCDAYLKTAGTINTLFGSLGQVIQYYDGSLYILCGEDNKSGTEYNVYLMKMNPDGTGHEKVTDNFDFEVIYWFIHRGYLYYATDSSVLRISIDNLKGEPETVYKAEHYVKNGQNTFPSMLPFGDRLYLEVDDVDDSGAGEGSYSVAVNLDTLEAARLEIDGKTPSFESFGDEYMLFSTLKKDGKKNIKTYYKTDADGNNPEKFLEMTDDEIETVWFDGKYYYFNNLYSAGSGTPQVITVYDKDLNKVDSFKLPKLDLDTCTFFTAQDENYFLFEYFNDNDEHMLVMADKSQIGSIGGETIKFTELCKLKWAEKKNSNYYVEG